MALPMGRCPGDPVEDCYCACTNREPFPGERNMKKAVMCVMLLSFLLPGCSEFLARQKDEKRKAIYTNLVIGTPRARIVEIIGEPIHKESEFVETYDFCMPTNYERGFNMVADVASLFLWEVIATPYELTTPCEYRADIVVVYDDEYKVLAYMGKGYYEDVKAVRDALLQRMNELQEDPKMVFLGYIGGAGWIYVDKTRIVCDTQENRVTVDAETVLALERALQYRFILESVSIPVVARETVVLDLNKREIKELKSSLINERGRDLGPTTEEDWADLFAMKKKEEFLNTLSAYCRTQELPSMQRVEGPTIRDFFAERIRETTRSVRQTPYR